MSILMTILYVVLFLVFLSILIIIHELGHLAAAKAFRVYCLEYSIGMGPLLFKHKGKNAETQFSLRAIPFGGYVSMYGEGVELPEGVVVDESRSLNGIKAWKRAIVLLAGVTMNAVLALVFFFTSNCFPQETLYSNSLNIVESSVAAEAGIPDGIVFKMQGLTYHDDVAEVERKVYLIDKEAIVDGNDTYRYAVVLNYEKLDSFKKRDIAQYLYVYALDGDEVDFKSYIAPNTITTLDFHITALDKDEDNKFTVDGATYTLHISPVEGEFPSFGCLLFYERWYYNFGQIVRNTFTNFGECSVILFKTIGDLITKPATWEQVGGIIAVGFETTSVLQNFGFGKFLFYWGFISVNLAIFNLLPFPGLDGWQLLVLIVEAIFRKKIPEKVKNIVSLIGIALLLLLMVVIVIKDLIKYVFMGVVLL